MNHEVTKITKNREEKIKREASIFHNSMLLAHSLTIPFFFVSFVPSW